MSANQSCKISEHGFEVMRDNLCIRGIEYRPEGTNLPIAVVCHGFLASYKTTKHYAKKFAEWGYAAYCFDFIGGGVGCKSDGKLTEMSVLTEKKDLYAVIDYVKGLPYTDAKSLVLMGCSQGGFVSAMVAAEQKEAVTKLILLHPALCIPDDARKGKMMFFKFDPDNIPDILSSGFLKIGGNYARDVINIDPYKEIAGYDGRVLILHGARDKIVNLSYAKNAKSAYGSNCSLSILPKAGHGFNKRDDKYTFYALKQFLDGKTEILTLDIRLAKSIKTMKEQYRQTIIPFTGTASGDYFNGDVMPGAQDVQTWKGTKLVGCRAEYTLSGKDYTGGDCCITVLNESPDGRNWSPKLNTNSNALSFLNDQSCEAYFSMRTVGPLIRIYGSTAYCGTEVGDINLQEQKKNKDAESETEDKHDG